MNLNNRIDRLNREADRREPTRYRVVWREEEVRRLEPEEAAAWDSRFDALFGRMKTATGEAWQAVQMEYRRAGREYGEWADAVMERFLDEPGDVRLRWEHNWRDRPETIVVRCEHEEIDGQ